MLNQEQLEITLLKAMTHEHKAVEAVIREKIDPKEDFVHTFEGDDKCYTRALCKIITSYYEDSHSLLTENSLGYLLKSNKYQLAPDDVRKIMSLFGKIQIQPYNSNDLYILIKQTKDHSALRTFRNLPILQAEWLETEGLESACINAQSEFSKILSKLRGDNDDTERIDMRKDNVKFFKEYQQREDNPELYEGIKIGMPEFDRATKGFQGGQVITIVGPSSGGKSVLKLNWAFHAYKVEHKKVAYFSFEMRGWLIMLRHLSREYKIPFYKFKGIELTPEEKDILKEDLAKPDEHGAWFKYIINTTNRTPDFIEEEINRMERSEDGLPDIIIVDYLGAMKSPEAATSKDKKRWENQEAALEYLWSLSMRKNIPIVTSQQLRSSVFTENRKLKQAGKQVQFQQDAAAGAAALIDYSYYVVALEPDKDTGEAIIHPVKIRDTWFSPFCIKWDSMHNGCYALSDEEQEEWRIQKGYTLVKNGGDNKSIIDESTTVSSNDDGDMLIQRGTVTEVIKESDLTLDGFSWDSDD